MQKLLELDAHLSTRLSIAGKPGFLRRWAILLAHSGDSWFWLMGLALLWLLGNSEWKFIAVVLLIGLVGTAVFVLAVKFTVRRRRPAGAWGNIYRSTDPHSFPSGHAARMMMLAFTALLVAPPWLGVGLLILAPCVSLARVAMGVHYVSDVLVGMLLGGLIGLGVGYWLPLVVK